MTQIETISAKIEQLKEELKDLPSSDYKDGVIYVLEEELIPFINSLSSEKPSEELEYIATSLEETIGTSPHSRETIISYLQQAAQWQKEQMINKACKWLNENIVEYHPRKGELRPIVNINAFREAMEN